MEVAGGVTINCVNEFLPTPLIGARTCTFCLLSSKFYLNHYLHLAFIIIAYLNTSIRNSGPLMLNTNTSVNTAAGIGNTWRGCGLVRHDYTAGSP